MADVVMKVVDIPKSYSRDLYGTNYDMTIYKY